MYKRLAYFILTSCCLSACYFDNEQDLYPLENCNTQEVTFSEVIRPIIDANCVLSGCHVPGTGRVDYTSFQGFKLVADDGRLRQRIVVERTMPPSGELSTCARNQIEAWLDEGALNN